MNRVYTYYVTFITSKCVKLIRSSQPNKLELTNRAFPPEVHRIVRSEFSKSLHRSPPPVRKHSPTKALHPRSEPFPDKPLHSLPFLPEADPPPSPAENRRRFYRDSASAKPPPTTFRPRAPDQARPSALQHQS